LHPTKVIVLMNKEDSKIKKLLKNLLKIVFPLILGGFILWYIYRDFDFKRAEQVLLHGTNWWWMFLSLVFGTMSHVFRGWRWRQTLEPLHEYPRRSTCVNAIFISYATNLILPRVGEVSRCGVLKKYDDVSFTKSLGTVVTERIIDSLVSLFIAGITFLLQIDIFRRFFNQTGTNIPSLSHIFSSAEFYIILLCTIGVIILLYYLFKLLPIHERVKGIFKNIWAGVISLKNVRNLPLFILYTALIWVCYFYQFYLTFFCFDFTSQLSVMAGLVLFVGGTLAVIVPTPNGAGPWHFAIISMMVLYGVNSTDAGIFALIVHSTQTLLVIILGIYGMIAVGFNRKKHEK
jgi:uncharacterized protein (TIRG00374 family)